MDELTRQHCPSNQNRARRVKAVRWPFVFRLVLRPVAISVAIVRAAKRSNDMAVCPPHMFNSEQDPATCFDLGWGGNPKRPAQIARLLAA
jgi:hypothetical protein